MNLPLWLDPTPLTAQFVGTFANMPVREPFIHLRKQTEEEQLTEAQKKQRAGGLSKAAMLKGAYAGGFAKSMQAQTDAAQRGETMRERRKRQGRELYQQKKDYYARKYREKKLAKLAAQGCAVERLKA